MPDGNVVSGVRGDAFLCEYFGIREFLLLHQLRKFGAAGLRKCDWRKRDEGVKVVVLHERPVDWLSNSRTPIGFFKMAVP